MLESKTMMKNFKDEELSFLGGQNYRNTKKSQGGFLRMLQKKSMIKQVQDEE